MGLFRPDPRRREAPDPLLDLRVLLFAIGAALGMTGMATGRSWIISLGVVVLAIGLLLRIIAARQRSRHQDARDDPDDAAPPDAR